MIYSPFRHFASARAWRIGSCIASFTACLFAPRMALAQTTLTAGSAGLTLGADGHVASLRLADRSIAMTPHDSMQLWIAHPSPQSDGTSAAPILPADAALFTSQRLSGASPGVRLTWSRFARAPGLVVTATVRLRASDGTSLWHLDVSGLRRTPLDSIRFPRVVGIPRLGTRETLIVPLWMGQQMHEPRARFASATAATAVGSNPLGSTAPRAQNWAYPGALSLQAVAVTSDDGVSMRISANDSLAYRKSFALLGNADGTLGFEAAHLFPDPGSADRFSLPYAVQLGVFRGDWMTLAEWYRSWGMQQRWSRESRVARKAVAPWVDSTGIWVWNRGRSPMVLDPAKQLQSYAGMPVSVFWHWWHKGPYDTSFPEYLPPREGAAPFTNAVKAAHDAGVHAIVYMNQRLWCTETPSWTARNAQQGAVRERDGKIRTEVCNIFDPIPCATMSVTSPFWRNTYTGIADTVVHQYGIDGIYMDQAVLSLVNWRRGAGMPVGGGNYWMAGFDSLAASLRRMARTTPIVLAGEGGGESWLPALDLFLTLQVSQERYADPASGWEPLPLFQSVYHEVANTYGTYGSLTYPPYDELWPDSTRPANALSLLDRKYAQQFRLEQARMFIWGMQPTIANMLPEQLTERTEEIDYMVRLATLRRASWRALHRGQFMRPPALRTEEITVPLSRISIYAARRGGPTEAERKTPAVLHGAWRAQDQSVAVPIASLLDTPTSVQLTLDPRSLGVRSGARLRLITPTGDRQLGVLRESMTLPIDLPPLGAVVLMIEPPEAPRRR